MYDPSHYATYSSKKAITNANNFVVSWSETVPEEFCLNYWAGGEPLRFSASGTC